jgi:hypothetical protein
MDGVAVGILVGAAIVFIVYKAVQMNKKKASKSNGGSGGGSNNDLPSNDIKQNK